MFEFKLENESGNIVDINDGVNYIVIPPVEGLNPPPASIFTSTSPNRKGGKYNGSTLNERNLIITIKILGDIEANRNALYSWVDTEQYIKVRYRNGVKNVYCEGHIQECPIDIFTDNETVTVNIICENPYWKDLQEIAAEVSHILQQFTFAFAIDSTGIPFSTIRPNSETSIYNAGAETGVKLTVKCSGEVKNLVIFDGQNTSRRFKLATTLQTDWIVIIDTESSPKTCKAYKPDGTILNLMKYISGAPTWLTLRRGNNIFGFTADVGSSNVTLTVGYTNKYLGV